MTVSIEGFYRNGKIELAEVASDVPDQARVGVTFTRRKIRPVLIVRADTLHAGLPQGIVAPIIQAELVFPCPGRKVGSRACIRNRSS